MSKPLSAITESPGCSRYIILLQRVNSLSKIIDLAYNLDTKVMIPEGEIPIDTLKVLVFLQLENVTCCRLGKPGFLLALQ